MSSTEIEPGMDNSNAKCVARVEFPQNGATEPANIAEIKQVSAEAMSKVLVELKVEAESESSIESDIAVNELKIDPEFKTLMPPLSAGEIEALKEDLSIHGCRDPLIVLKGEGIILDGHHRYEICRELQLPYKANELEFPSRTDAKIWMIKNQRSRRSLNESQRAMLAVNLESLYSEQAKERMGTRTDLGQDLDPNEAGRSAEKAAKDMGISHQTVSFAKKVANSGIPELIQMVRDSKIAVSAAAKVADFPTDQKMKVQEKIAAKSEKKAKDGNISSRVTSSEVEAMIKGVNLSNKPKKTSEEKLIRIEKFLTSIKKILETVDITTQQDELDSLLRLSEEIINQVKAIGLRSSTTQCEHELVTGEYQLEIRAEILKTFLDSVVLTDRGVKLKFESDGVYADNYNEAKSFVSSSFLPREYFSRYDLETCEVCLRKASELSCNLCKGKVRIFVEPETTYHHERVIKIYSGFEDGGVIREAEVKITRSQYIDDDLEIIELTPSCKMVVSISSKDFINSLKDIRRTKIEVKKKTRYARYANLSMEESLLKIVADGAIQKIPCNVIEQGEADSEFDLSYLADGDINRVIEKSNMIALGFGKDYPLIIDVTVGKMRLKYILSPLVNEELSEEHEWYRGVLCDRNGKPVLDEHGHPIVEDQDSTEMETIKKEGPEKTNEVPEKLEKTEQSTSDEVKY